MSLGRTACILLSPIRAPTPLERTLRPFSPIYDREFLEACRPLYSVHMGVENAASLLYSLIRFVKPKSVVEVGAGYTSLWLLRALADNDDELKRLSKLQEEGGADLLSGPGANL